MKNYSSTLRPRNVSFPREALPLLLARCAGFSARLQRADPNFTLTSRVWFFGFKPPLEALDSQVCTTTTPLRLLDAVVVILDFSASSGAPDTGQGEAALLTGPSLPCWLSSDSEHLLFDFNFVQCFKNVLAVGWSILPSVFVFSTFYFEIIVNSQEVIKSVHRALCCFHQPPPVTAS